MSIWLSAEEPPNLADGSESKVMTGRLELTDALLDLQKRASLMTVFFLLQTIFYLQSIAIEHDRVHVKRKRAHLPVYGAAKTVVASVFHVWLQLEVEDSKRPCLKQLARSRQTDSAEYLYQARGRSSF